MEYCVIHGKDMYWTGEKIAAAPEKFRTFLAINQGRVIGYLDVTHCFEENEPYDIYVLPEYRRKGYGRKLLAKALDCNQPRGMMLAGRNRQHSRNQAVRVDEFQDRARAKRFDGPLADSGRKRN